MSDELGREQMMPDDAFISKAPGVLDDAANEVWSPEDTDLFLDMFLNGAAWATLGVAVKRDHTTKSLPTKYWRLVANYRDQGYTPVNRKDRTGLPWTKRERKIVREARECKSKEMGDNRPHYLALILARPVQAVQDVWDRKGANKGFGI